MLGLISVQTVCKSYQQTTPVGEDLCIYVDNTVASKRKALFFNIFISSYRTKNDCDFVQKIIGSHFIKSLMFHPILNKVTIELQLIFIAPIALETHSIIALNYLISSL